MIQVLTDKPNSRYLPALQAGIKLGLRPSAVVLRDHYALNRSKWDWWHPKGEPQWRPWDYAILDAIAAIESFTNPETGYYQWVDEADDVTWKIKIRTSNSRAAVEKYEKTERGKNLQPGERLHPYPVFDDPEDPPTFAKWMEKD